MDRVIERSVRYRRLAGRAGGVALALVATGILLSWLPGWLTPTLRAARMRTARVERGRVEATVEAAGTVQPAFEKVLTSPVETRVLRVLRRPGDALQTGDAILELDTSVVRLERERGEERLAQKQNEQEQVRLALDRTLQELGAAARSAALDLEMLTYRAEQYRQLREQGLVSEEKQREVEVEARKAAITLDSARESAQAESLAADAKLRGLALDISIQRKEIEQAGRRLERATARADRAGVLTWVVEQEGSTLRAGDVMARIADLTSFRVEGSVSDVHAAKLRPGQATRVVLDDRVLSGTVRTIDPTIEKGVVRFEVALDEPDHAALRNNLRVDVHVVTDARDDVLKVRKFPSASGGAVRNAFIVRNDSAYRTRVRVGLSGYEEFEVLDGLTEGDEVVISDMQDYEHMGEVKIR